MAVASSLWISGLTPEDQQTQKGVIGPHHEEVGLLLCDSGEKKCFTSHDPLLPLGTFMVHCNCKWARTAAIAW